MNDAKEWQEQGLELRWERSRAPQQPTDVLLQLHGDKTTQLVKARLTGKPVKTLESIVDALDRELTNRGMSHTTKKEG